MYKEIFGLFKNGIYIWILFKIFWIAMAAIAMGFILLKEWYNKKEISILNETDIEKLESGKDQCEAINNVLFSGYMPVIILLLTDTPIFLIVVLCLIILFVALILQLVLCIYKKAIRKTKKSQNEKDLKEELKKACTKEEVKPDK